MTEANSLLAILILLPYDLEAGRFVRCNYFIALFPNSESSSIAAFKRESKEGTIFCASVWLSIGLRFAF